MAQVTVPFALDGLRLMVVVTPTPEDMSRRAAGGLPLLGPVNLWAEIDTGATLSAVATSTLAHFGLRWKRQSETQSFAGPVSVDIFEVSIGLPAMFGLAAPTVLMSKIEVTAIDHPIPGTDALVGLNALLDCRLLVDGPGRTFSLDF